MNVYGSTFEHIRLVGRGFEAERGRVSRQRRRCQKGGEEKKTRSISESGLWKTGIGTKKPTERGTNATEPETEAAFSLPLHIWMWMYQKQLHSLYRPARRPLEYGDSAYHRFTCISVFHVPFMLFLYNEAVPAYLSDPLCLVSLGQELAYQKALQRARGEKAFQSFGMFPKMRCLKCKAKEIVKRALLKEILLSNLQSLLSVRGARWCEQTPQSAEVNGDEEEEGSGTAHSVIDCSSFAQDSSAWLLEGLL